MTERSIFCGSYDSRNRMETYTLGKFQGDGSWGHGDSNEKQIQLFLSNSLI